MENKYYTPTIEEFHVGFEYEVYEDYDVLSEKSWHKETYPSDTASKFYINEGLLRVKYLDLEDIESLGFESTKPLWYQYHNDRYMIVDLSNKGDNMYSITEKRDDTYLFYGKIKNKSELKKVLKMIGYE